MKVKVKSLSPVRLFETPWTVAYQDPPSMGFFRQEYWSGLPFPSPGDIPDPRIKPRSPALEADALPSEPPGQSNCLRREHRSWCILLPYTNSSSYRIFTKWMLYCNIVSGNSKKVTVESQNFTSNMQMTPPLWQKVKRN